jgi:hypothetical protein
MSCAVLANLLQQWARKYLKVTRPRPTASEPKRARYHAFYADGVENFLLPWVFEALPAMLHLSVFLFFAGLVVFLRNFDPKISKLILSWVAGCVILYGYITFIPTFRHDSPYHTPLTPLAWSIVTGIPFLAFWILEWYDYFYNFISLRIQSCIQCICSSCNLCSCLDLDLVTQILLFVFTSRKDPGYLAEAADHYRKKIMQGLQKAADKTALDLQLVLSGRAFMWTFDSLHEDNELERFFSSLPSFRGSNDDDDEGILSRLTKDQKENLWTGLIGFLDRTLSSDSIHQHVKNRRAKICTNALDSAAFPYILDSIVSEDQYGPVRSVKIACFVRDWKNGDKTADPILVQAIVSSVVATTQLRNDDWFTITSDELGVAESVIRNYTTHDLSLAILIHVTCRQFNNFKESSWPSDTFSKVLRAASKIKVRQSSPELQLGFCALWNHIVRQARADDDYSPKITRFILRPIRKVYIDIHKRTYAAQRTRFSALADHFADILRNNLPEFPLSPFEDYHLYSTLHGHGGSTVITFARIAAVFHPTSETSTPALASVTTPPGASPAMTFAPDPAAVAEDDGKPIPRLCKEMDTHALPQRIAQLSQPR